MSDNGPAGEDFYNRGSYVDFIRDPLRQCLREHGPTNFLGFLRARSGRKPVRRAFSRFKRSTREGGITAPFIVAGPQVGSRGVIDDTYLTVMDLAPTFLELAGARYPDDGSVRPMLGESMVPLLTDLSPCMMKNYVTTLYHGGRAFVRKGRWKLVTLDPPFDESRFELFDVEADPGERTIWPMPSQKK